MPNWCFSNLMMTGETKEVKRFVEGLKALPATYPDDEELKQDVTPCYTLNSYVPVPAEVQARPYSPDFANEDIKPNDQVCGYNWQIEHWGSKWDAFAHDDRVQTQLDQVLAELNESKEPDAQVYFHFESAWSPIITWVETVGQQFPNITLELQYEEEGEGFAGVLVVQGEHVEHREYDNITVYRVQEGEADWFSILEDFYYNAVEYLLDDEGLKDLPASEEDHEEWESAVYDIVSSEAHDYFAELVKKTDYKMDEIIEHAMKNIKTLIRI